MFPCRTFVQVDKYFLPPDVDLQQDPLPCGVGLSQYTPFRVYAYSHTNEGTAVLLKRGVFEVDPDAPSPAEASVAESTASGKKTATVVWARRVGQPDARVAVVSVHLKGGPPGQWSVGHAEREYLLRQVVKSLRRYPAPVVLGGDFNIRPGEWQQRLHTLLKEEVCFACGKGSRHTTPLRSKARSTLGAKHC